MDYSSPATSLYLFLLAGLLSAAAAAVVARAPGLSDTVIHAFRDLEVEAQLSPPMRCSCYTVDDPESSEGTQWYCDEESDPSCYHPLSGGPTALQEVKAASTAEAMGSCVCHLQMDEEADLMAFTCSHPHCYKRFGDLEEIVKTNNWPSYKHECTDSSVHKDDPDCCRCIYNKWNCHTLNSTCERVYKNCPIERQVKVEGSCCPACLEENIPSHQSYSSDDVVSCECSVCKQLDSVTGDLQLEISRSHPQCRCDFNAHYPYDDIPQCSLSEEIFEINRLRITGQANQLQF